MPGIEIITVDPNCYYSSENSEDSNEEAEEDEDEPEAIQEEASMEFQDYGGHRKQFPLKNPRKD